MPRKYEQRRRAEQQEETRRRIVAAAVGLHGLQGPARTSLSAVAEKAGVQRNTLYRYFPDERSLLDACSEHYARLHPMPGAGRPAAWADVVDPVERRRQGLRELYAYWEENAPMVAHVLRDAEIEPLVREASARHWGVPLGDIRAALLAGSPEPAVAAVVDLAMSFWTWQSLQRSGLSTTAAADLMARLPACADESA